jgi:hypothetical protein
VEAHAHLKNINIFDSCILESIAEYLKLQRIPTSQNHHRFRVRLLRVFVFRMDRWVNVMLWMGSCSFEVDGRVGGPAYGQNFAFRVFHAGQDKSIQTLTNKYQ